MIWNKKSSHAAKSSNYLDFWCVPSNHSAIFSMIVSLSGEMVTAKTNSSELLISSSSTEKRFARELDIQNDVEMYVKLPGGFYINTPFGKYNPDWAVVLNEPDQKHVYFIAETKGVSDSIQLTLKGVENAKIESAREHFKVISNNEVKYEVVDRYEKMITKLVD